MNHGIFVGQGEGPLYLWLPLANRHGLIAGATGTGKTVTLQILAEGFSSCGIPVFLADVKGDLAGISQPGEAHYKIMERAQAIGMRDLSFQGFPTLYWDLFGEQGHQVRTTISEMGPLLLARLLGLNEAQEGVLSIAFKLADSQGLLLLDFKDLRAILNYMGDQARRLSLEYGHVASSSIGAIQRKLLVLEQQGGEKFFGEPALVLNDLMYRHSSGFGMISILAADKLIQNRNVYATFLLWLLAELLEQLPEVGDQQEPKLILFFDEAHLLFTNVPAVLMEKIELAVRLIRSKGVGVYLVTQNPLDIPDPVLGQLGNRIQHALRAFTPRQQRAVHAAAQTLRPNPGLDTEQIIMELGVGEALVSMLDEEGIPAMVQRGKIRPPSSRIGPITPAERRISMVNSPIRGKYDQGIDRKSAYEMLMARAKEASSAAEERGGPPGTERQAPPPRDRLQSLGEAMAKSFGRSLGSHLGRRISRGILGSIFKGK